MHISMGYAEAIIGAEGTNIDYIRRTSGAIISVRESAIMPEEMRVDIRGSSSQVQLAQELIKVIKSLLFLLLLSNFILILLVSLHVVLPLYLE